MKQCFHKTIASNRIIVNGKAVHFDPIDGNCGVIELDSDSDAALIDGLTKFANEQRGGVTKITCDQMAEKKSLRPYSPTSASALKRRDLLQVATPLPKKPSQSPSANANVAAVKPAPVVTVSPPAPVAPVVPDGTAPKAFRPKTSKLKPLDLTEPT